MTQHIDEKDVYIQGRLQQLKLSLPRDPQKASSGRERYLVQVRDHVNGHTFAPAVSVTVIQRLNGWISNTLTPRPKKERFSMFTTLTTILVAVTMLFGGAGATVYAAQESLPDDLLYPVKTFSEDTQLLLTKDPQRQLDLLMVFTDRRMDEIKAKTSAGEPVPVALAVRFQHEMNHMFRVIAGMEEPIMIETLAYVGVHIRKHDRDMDQIRYKQPDQADPQMDRVREMLRLRIHLVEEGLEDPLAFRNYVHQYMSGNGFGPGPSNQGNVTQPGDGYGPGPGPVDPPPCDDCPQGDNGNKFGPGPSNQGNVTQPGDGYGPGPGPVDPPPCDDCPQGDNGNKFGPGPSNQGNVTQPGDGYGPGPGPVDPPPCDDCPQGDNGSRFGPGPTNQGEITQPDDGYGLGQQTSPNCNGCQQEVGGGNGGSSPGSSK